jgi:predicted nuclease with TOPRIM domain
MRTYVEGIIKGFSHNIKTVEELENKNKHLEKKLTSVRNEAARLYKIIDKTIDEIKYFELLADHLDDNIYLDKILSNKLLEILKGNEK